MNGLKNLRTALSLIFLFTSPCLAAEKNSEITKVRTVHIQQKGSAPAVNSSTTSSTTSKNGRKKATQRTVSPTKKKPVYSKKISYRSISPVPRKGRKFPAAQPIRPIVEGPVPQGFVSEVSSPTDPRLERAIVQKITPTELILQRMPVFTTSYRGKMAGLTDKQDFVQYSVDPTLQDYARGVVSRASAMHVAIVAMEPSTGRILAIAGKSPTLPFPAMHAGYPAASLIKVVTAAAAVEHGAMDPLTEVAFRGGTYELSPLNYDPRPGADRRIMSVSEALGRSCNPVFSRVALQFLNPSLLRYQTSAFGFNSDLKLQVPLQQSVAVVPNEDYDFGRTAAGFGEVYLSPVHAATIMSAIANEGSMSQPSIVDQVTTMNGDVRYLFRPSMIRRSIRPQTAATLLQMMTATTTIGTSRREFEGKVPWEVPAKTGTLKGENPKGLNNWFIASAPLHNPKIAVAVVVVNPRGQTGKASHLGRLLLEKYLG